MNVPQDLAEVLAVQKSYELTTNQAKSAYALGVNVKRLVERFGIEHVLFQTFTLPEVIRDRVESQRRFKSFETHCLSQMFPTARVGVVQRHKSGGIHWHFLTVGDHDYRTGFNWDEAELGIYTSASPALRAVWEELRERAPKYGLGRCESLPIRSSAEAVGQYVGRYIAKHLDRRQEEDKGMRLVRYAGDARRCSCRLAWNSPGARAWRAAVSEFAKDNDCRGLDELTARLGGSWAYRLGDAIIRAYGRQEDGSMGTGVRLVAQRDSHSDKLQVFVTRKHV